MKIRSIKANNHKKVFEVRTYKGAYEYPYAKLDLRPTNANPLADFYVMKNWVMRHLRTP